MNYCIWPSPNCVRRLMAFGDIDVCNCLPQLCHLKSHKTYLSPKFVCNAERGRGRSDKSGGKPHTHRGNCRVNSPNSHTCSGPQWSQASDGHSSLQLPNQRPENCCGQPINHKCQIWSELNAPSSVRPITISSDHGIAVPN